MERLEELSSIFKALSDPVRLKLLRMLPEHQEKKEFCVCKLAEGLGVSQPNVSHHLKVLKQAGLVKCEKNETFCYYTVDKKRLKEIFCEMEQQLEK